MDVKAEMTTAVREMVAMWADKLLEQDALPFCILAYDSVGGMHVVRVPDTVMDKEEFVNAIVSFAINVNDKEEFVNAKRFNAGVRN